MVECLWYTTSFYFQKNRFQCLLYTLQKKEDHKAIGEKKQANHEQNSYPYVEKVYGCHVYVSQHCNFNLLLVFKILRFKVSLTAVQLPFRVQEGGNAVTACRVVPVKGILVCRKGTLVSGSICGTTVKFCNADVDRRPGETTT